MPTVITTGALSARAFGFTATSDAHWADALSDGTNGVIINSCATDPQGNLVVVGSYTVVAAGGRGIIAKISTAGSILWQRQLYNSGTPASRFYDVTTDSSGNIYACGWSGNGTIAQVAKYSAFGVIQWQKSFPDFALGDCAHSIAVDGSGNVYIGGTQTSTSRAAIVQLDSSGALGWARNFTIGGGQTSAADPVLTTDGTAVYAVFPTSDGTAALKIDNTGALSWGTTVATLLATTAGCPALIGSSLYYIGNDGVSTGLFKRNASTGACTLYTGAQANMASTGVKGGSDGLGGYYFGGLVNGDPGGVTKADVTGTPTLSWSRTLISTTGTNSVMRAVSASGSAVYPITFISGAQTVGAAYRLRTDGTITGTYGTYTYASLSPPSLSAASPATSQSITASSFSPTISTTTLTDAATTVTLSQTRFT